MVPRWVRYAALTLGLGLMAAPTAHADTRWSIQLGVGGPVGRAPVPYGYVWQPGHYVWTGYDYLWMEGQWVPRGAYGPRAFVPVPYGYGRDDRRWNSRGRWDRDFDREWRGRDWDRRDRDDDRRWRGDRDRRDRDRDDWRR